MEDCESDEEEENFSLPLSSFSSPIEDDAACSFITAAEESKTKRSSADHTRTIVHIDIDCFYAQVEMILDPSLRDRPLGIQQKYLLVTCNYKAREQGVTKLMSIAEAKSKCPNVVIVKGEDLTKYREMSGRIFDLLKSHCSVVERLGFDETFLDVSSLVQQRLASNSLQVEEVNGHLYGGDRTETAKCSCGCHTRLMIGSHIAAELRESLHSTLGITSSAGIAHNKLLSKMVGSMHKPNQQTTLLPGDARTLMMTLKARDIPGIGHSTAKKLQEIGIRTVQDLTACPIATLNAEFGQTAASKMKGYAIGIDPSPVVLSGVPKSVSDEDSFKKCSSFNDARKTMESLITNLLPRLKDSLSAPQTVRLTIRRYNPEGVDYQTRHRRESKQQPLPSNFHLCHDPEEKHRIVLKIVLELFSKLVDVRKPFHLTLINVCFTNFKTAASSSTVDVLLKSTLSKKRKSVDNGFYQEASSRKVACVDRNNQPSSSQGRTLSVCTSSEKGSSNGSGNAPQTMSPTAADPQDKNSAADSQRSLPVDVDPQVFAELPVSIQRELLSQWRRPGHGTHKRNSPTSNEKQKKLTGIHKYFSK